MLKTVAILGGLVSSVLGSPLHVATGCDANLAAAGLCGESNGTVLEISQTHRNPGTDGPIDNRSDPGTGNPLPPCVTYLNARCVDYIFQRAEEASPGTPTITITDLASFAPEPTTLAVEPDNAGIANMPANFLAEASVSTQVGTLFDIPLTVRFTPIAYDYTYGDGTTASTTTPGRSWAELGQAQFTPTATSHVYTERGTYDADVDVRYTAEIDFGLGWYPISGELTTDGPSQQIQIFEAHTALVAHTCTERPTAPGC